MLKKQHRLTASAFDEAFRTGRRRHSEFCTLVVAPSPSFHAAVVVGKKCYKRAVDRNRLRRRLYDVMRSRHATLLPATYLCIVKPKATTVPYAVVRDELVSLLGQAVS